MMKYHRYGKEEQAKTLEQYEVAMDEDLGKEKGPERQTNVVVRTNCPCVMVAKEEKGIWKINRLDLEKLAVQWTQVYDRNGEGTHQDLE